MKPLADLTADEALAEIQSLIDMNTDTGRRIDQLAGHLMLLAMNAQTAQREHFQYTERRLTHAIVVAAELGRILQTTKGRKTVARADVELAYRMAIQ